LGHSASPSPAPAPSVTNPMEMFTDVRFIRPTLATNVEGGDGTMQVDYTRIDRVVVTDGIGPNAATEVGAITVNSDTYNFPSAAGIQDRTFTAFDYVNQTDDAIDVEVSVTGSRRYTTPAGLSGVADARSFIVILNVTTSLLVSSTQDFMQNQIEDQAANVSQIYFESTLFNLSVPANTTYRFTPYFRSFTDVGSTGTLTVETKAYTMRVTAVKK